jgi:hypothetical protein
VPLSQLLHLDVAKLSQRRREVDPMPMQRRRFEAVFGSQPVLARIGKRHLGRMHVCALGDVAAHRV